MTSLPFFSALDIHELIMEGGNYDQEFKGLFSGVEMQCAHHCTSRKVAEDRRQISVGFEAFYLKISLC